MPYALVVLNTNDFQTSSTSNGSSVMQTTQPPGTTLVDVLDPAQATYPVDGNAEMQVSVPAQKAMILIPQSQLAQGPASEHTAGHLQRESRGPATVDPLRRR